MMAWFGDRAEVFFQEGVDAVLSGLLRGRIRVVLQQRWRIARQFRLLWQSCQNDLPIAPTTAPVLSTEL
ncbi:hypothetical protein [Actimicrobium sp. CCI2.3]|uniref:hypothetical protein n=1 Tax=Actimicrobium sp. CCI2.3 TaxID=3048616 RepID=UPI002AB40587|nr:hypothetical protein [Actimicrobium sp. CCI2.3]MDY7574931.1 hypothetical protein [Actimicrobium sp. CCI2.3]MEB0023337.1 hypothetical protein [Actimicrobium sp. CCI2.3]